MLVWRTPSRFITPAQAEDSVAPADRAGAGPGELQTRIVLPRGYTTKHCWPVLYLLHGAGIPEEWITRGDALAVNARAILVLPGGGPSWYVDWWNGGLRSPGWESWIEQELIPMVQSRLPVCAGRRYHSIAGLSMGGYGAVYLASQLPQYFGSAASFDGTLHIGRVEFEEGYGPFAVYWGPPNGFYAIGHDPYDLAANLRATRVLEEDGNGTPMPGDSGNASSLRIEELETLLQSQDFLRVARAAHVPVTFDEHLGVHDWITWSYDLRRMLAWNPFKAVPATPQTWRYSTVAATGTVWGYHFRFSVPPTSVLTIARSGGIVKLHGTGILALSTPQHREYVAQLPFTLQGDKLRAGAPGSSGPGGGSPQTIPLLVTPSSPTFRQALHISFTPTKRIPRSQRYQVSVVSWGSSCSDFRSTRLWIAVGHRASVTLGPDPKLNGGRWCDQYGLIDVQVVGRSAPAVTLGQFLAEDSVKFRAG